MTLVQVQQQQEQEEKKKKKLLTFEEICPKWAEALATGYCNNPLHMNIGIYDCCIVGEAHGFRNHYGCMECDRFSSRFNSYIRQRVDGGRKVEIINVIGFDYTKQQFVDHWNEQHI